MGSSLVKGWISSHSIFKISIVEKNTKLIDQNRNKKINFFKSLDEFILKKIKIDFIILAIKPQQIDDLKNKLNKFNFKEVVFISILAGKSLEWFKQNISRNINLVRAMPNLPASVLKGTTGVYCPRSISIEQKNKIEKILSSIGYVSFVKKENLIDVVTSISGSGPAYYYYLTEILFKFGIKMGLTKKSAENFAYNTFIGSAKLLENQKIKNVSLLRKHVTSPGGTTEAALQVLMDKGNGFPTLIEKALKNAIKRARTLKG